MGGGGGGKVWLGRKGGGGGRWGGGGGGGKERLRRHTVHNLAQNEFIAERKPRNYNLIARKEGVLYTGNSGHVWQSGCVAVYVARPARAYTHMEIRHGSDRLEG